MRASLDVLNNLLGTQYLLFDFMLSFDMEISSY